MTEGERAKWHSLVITRQMGSAKIAPAEKRKEKRERNCLFL